MVSYTQSPPFSSLIPVNNKNNFFKFKKFKISFSLSPSSSEPSSNFQEKPQESQPLEEKDPIKLAFAKAKEYKKSKQSNPPITKIVQNPLADVGGKTDGSKSEEVSNGDVNKEVPLAVKLTLEKAKEYKQSKDTVETKISSINIARNDGLKSDDVKDDGGGKEVPVAVKFALEKAKEYKKNKDFVGSNTVGVGGSETLDSGLKGGNVQNLGGKQLKNAGKEELTISSADFMGLGFSDKRSGRSLPAGLVPISDPFPEGELPEVEILVGDTSKFGNAVAESKLMPVKEDDAEVYKPKVSTWGVFPRPNNISKTYGGGRTIRPGDALETAEVRADKEARTRQLLAAYKRKTGTNIDPKLKFDCEKALKDGDSLMDFGKLQEALPFYEQVMEKLPFQSELHGLAALQWSICQDSLSRPNEARVMYEKLQSHPFPSVSKKARQFMFGFQAMDMMKVTSSTVSPLSTGYQNYFEAFIKDKTKYPFQEAEGDEGSLSTQALPYLIFLLSPILIVLIAAASRLQ